MFGQERPLLFEQERSLLFEQEGSPLFEQEKSRVCTIFFSVEKFFSADNRFGRKNFRSKYFPAKFFSAESFFDRPVAIGEGSGGGQEFPRSARPSGQ